METAEINDNLSSIDIRDEDLFLLPQERVTSASSSFYSDLPSDSLNGLRPPSSSEFNFESDFKVLARIEDYVARPVRTSSPISESQPTPPSYENGTSSGVATTPSSMYPRQRVSGYTFSSSGRSWCAYQPEVSDASSSSISPIQQGPAANTRVAPPRPPRPQDDTMSFIYYDLSCLFASSRPSTAGSADIERPLSSN